MRILHLNSEKGYRGGERQMELLALGLRERGHEQLLAGPAGAIFPARFRELGFDVVEWPKPAFLGNLSTAPVRALRHAAVQFRPDIIHAHTGNAHSLAVRAFLGRVPIVTTRRVDFAIKSNIVSRRKYTAPGQHFIAISSEIRRVLLDGGVPAERIDLVPSGVNVDRVRGGDGTALRCEWLGGAGGPLIGFVGALVDHKAPWILAEAAALVRKELPGARVVFVGEGEERPRLEAIAASSNGAVLLTGWREDIADCYAAFDLFVMPSKLEGLCTALIDALAAGVPSIASRAGGIPDVVEDGVTGVLVPPLDAAALAATIVLLWNDVEQRKKFAEAGRERVAERFTAEAMVAGTEGVYYRVCKLL